MGFARKKSWILALIVVGLLAYYFGNLHSSAPDAIKESAFDRIMRTGEIRCAYASYAPGFMKDPNTGQFSGIYYDVMTEIGQRLNLKINWIEEVGYGAIPEGFVTGRYDAFCSVIFPTAGRSRAGGFTIPLYYSPVDVFVRADDHRFDNDLSKLNDHSIRFAGRDGDISVAFTKAAFPNATVIYETQISDNAQILDDVVHNKADAAVNEPGLLYLYLEKNPETLRNITAEHPIRVSPDAIMIGPKEYQLKMMFDTTLQEMLNSGFIDKVLLKYEKYPIFLHVSQPYQLTAH